jgi:hypothetical protein
VANLIITNACNLRCDFCFASEYLAGEADCATERMDLEELERQLVFTGGEAARFCGGEPTTHPDFLAMLRLALDEPGRSVFMMTNGVWPDEVRAFIAALARRDARRLEVLINTLDAGQYTRRQRAQLEATLGALDPDTVTLGFTIDRPDYDYAHILDLAKRLGVRRVRFSVASPNVTDPGSWMLDPERDYPRVAAVVHALFQDAARLRVQVHSDCGYLPPCVFTDEQLRDLEGLGERLKFSCEGATDIGPGGEAWRCYGLKSVVRANTADFEDSAALADDLERQTRELVDPRSIAGVAVGDEPKVRELAEGRWLFDACAECGLRLDGTCAGGCYALRAVRSAKARSGTDLGDDALMSAVPQIDDARLRVAGDRAMLLDEGGVWVQVPLSAGERRALEACDGARTVADIVARAKRRDLLKDPSRSVTRAIRRFYERGALCL